MGRVTIVCDYKVEGEVCRHKGVVISSLHQIPLKGGGINSVPAHRSKNRLAVYPVLSH